MAPESTTSGREDPISPYSFRRKSVQVILAMALILIVNVTLLVQTIAVGDRALVVLASLCLALFVFTFYRLVRTGLRTVALEIWIRHMGEGNLDYRVELAGNDEVNEAADALERLRQRSIEAQQLDLVRELSDDLQQKNEELQRVLLELQADSMDKIFNPFYTTKPSGTGVPGLGSQLSPASVVRQYGGSITAQSEPGEFTEMTVRLPTTGRGASAG